MPKISPWAETFHCKYCKKPRPKALQHNSVTCKMCWRKRSTAYSKRHRVRKKLPERKARQQCQTEYLKLKQKRPECIRAPVEDFYEFYENAVAIENAMADLGTWRTCSVRHIIPLAGGPRGANRSKVCGLHVPCNMWIVAQPWKKR